MADAEESSPNRKNIRLLIEYRGTAYVGWQEQEGLATIQGELARALTAITGSSPALRAAGRTDAGVHAIAQVANFYTEHPMEARRFAPALNAHLPDDISIHRSEEVALSFDSRHDSKSKRYRYRLYQGPQPAAWEADRAWHIRYSLDIDRMREAASSLLGERDFNAFRSSQCDAPHAQREMFSITIETAARPPVGQHIDITFNANAYCRHMCRILAGTLAEVGSGRRHPQDVEQVLSSGDRRRAGMTAPAHGLTLLEVVY